MKHCNFNTENNEIFIWHTVLTHHLYISNETFFKSLRNLGSDILVDFESPGFIQLSKIYYDTLAWFLTQV